MPNINNSIIDSHFRLHTDAMLTRGRYTKALDSHNQFYDEIYGQRDLCANLKGITNEQFAEMKKIQQDIPGFKK